MYFSGGSDAQNANIVIFYLEKNVVDCSVGVGGKKHAFAFGHERTDNVRDSSGLSSAGHS